MTNSTSTPSGIGTVILAEWIAKLREEGLPQTKGVLMNADGGMCCLGVLSVLANVDHTHQDNDLDHVFNFTGYEDKLEGENSEPADILVSCSCQPTYAFLKAVDPRLVSLQLPLDPTYAGGQTESSLVNVLMWMNDDGSSFAEIADLIEEKLS